MIPMRTASYVDTLVGRFSSSINRDSYVSVKTGRNTHRWQCPQARIPCPHQIHGCAILIARSELPAHLVKCPYEALGNFFELHEARFKTLEKQNDELNKQVQDLQTELRTSRVQREWRQPHAPVPGSGTYAMGAARPAWDQTYGGGGVPGLRALGGVWPEPQNRTSLVTDTPTSQPRSHGFPSFGSQERHADHAFGRFTAATPMEPAMTPLNEVVAQLASSLDHLQRRQEV